MDCVAIDFEASCLPRDGRSFPIEVGIAGPEGVTAWLIRPHASWRDWDWTEEALALHRIEPTELERTGKPVQTVFAELRRAIRGRRVVADSLVDAYWWNSLARAAGHSCASPIEHVGSILDEFGATTQEVLDAQAQADAISPARHRAADDARWLWSLLTELDRLVDGRCAPQPRIMRSPVSALAHAFAA